MSQSLYNNILIPMYMYCNGYLKQLLKKNVQYSFQEDFDPIFHRTKYMNEMLVKVLKLKKKLPF